MAKKEYIELESAKKVLEEHYAFNSAELLDEVPKADVQEVRHSKWEPCFDDWRKQIEGDECSACGFQHYGTNIRDYPFCPNCGARMDGGVKE